VAHKSGSLKSANTVSGGRTRKIVFRRRILLIALMVGLCSAVSAQAAVAPVRSIQLKASPKAIAYAQVMKQWNSNQQFGCLVELWERESHWNPLAHNKSSGAFGIAQFMPQTWANYKTPKSSEAGVQITVGLRYIYKRYGSPCEAWAFWQKQAKKGNPWY